MTTQLSPLAIQHFTDNNGNLLAGGQLYTYAAGTSTPLATYTDSTGGTANANPVIMNARGEANVWTTVGLAYKFVLKDASGNLIWSVDNITDPTKDAAMVGFLQAGTGAVSRTVAAKLQESVSVLDFGADPTGVSDSTAAFAKAIAASNSVYVPPGNYKVSNVQILEAIHLRGAGKDVSIIYCSSANQAAIEFGDGTTQYYGGCVEDIGFTGAAGVTGVSGQRAIFVQKFGQFAIRNVKVSASGSALYQGIYFLSASQYKYESVDVEGCLADGVTLLGTNDAYMTDCRSDSNGGAGFQLNGAQGTYAKSCTAYQNNIGWDLQSGSPSVSLNKNNWFIGCVGDTSANNNWQIFDSYDSYFLGCWGATQKSTTANTGACGFYLYSQYVKGLFFIGGDALNNNGQGVQLYDDGTNGAPSNVHFIGFQFGSAATGGGGNGKSGSGWGFVANGGAANINIVGGAFESNASGPLLDQTSAGGITVSGAPVGYPTATAGFVTLAVGASTASVTHGLGKAPNLANVQVWFGSDAQASGVGSTWAASSTSTTFTVNVNAAVTTTPLTVFWRASLPSN